MRKNRTITATLFSLCLLAGAGALLPQAAQAEFDLVACLGSHTKAECSRQMMIEVGQDTPLANGEDFYAASNKYAITIQGDRWMQNGGAGKKEAIKDLAILKESGVGKLEIDPSDVLPDQFEASITQEMAEMYKGLEQGFNKGNITINRVSEIELIPMSLAGGNGTLGRFCYHIAINEGKNVCVYRGYVRSTSGQSYVLLGSIGDYENMRAELESMIMSLKFLDAPAAQ